MRKKSKEYNSNNKINILDTIKIKTGLISNTYLVDNELIYIFDLNCYFTAI